ncbi:hypothetical protein AZE42_09884 [Rhizopogon vesiculosus]|uniref:Uncharacterized protein n=1 Tax=Rhizopogon vesiculosus TaxID=180088 RepID=A0A1J8Q7T9_9AGAM|nr:hypothetical protein AZE42_09884 [Rhizopogon vesiculosus]
MVNRRISENIKSCAVQLWNHGWDMEDILSLLKKPPSPLVGRTRIIIRALMTAAEDLFAGDSDLFLDEACMRLAFQHNITMSPSTSSCNLTQAGLTRKVLQRLASERDEACREDFKVNLRSDFVGDGSEFVVVDETM